MSTIRDRRDPCTKCGEPVVVIEIIPPQPEIGGGLAAQVPPRDVRHADRNGYLGRDPVDDDCTR